MQMFGMPLIKVSDKLETKLQTLPTRPGCYLLRGAQGEILYVGKAMNLRARVRSYFQVRGITSAKTQRMVGFVKDVDWIVTDSELEALILENELIKRHKPYYNVRLKDDKTYPYIKIHWQDDFPKISIVRRVERDGAKYYGPFTSAWAVRQTLDALRPIFPYLTCDREITGNDPRPCLYYHIKRCAGPCIGAVNRDEYRAIVAGFNDFLEGNTAKVMQELQRRMLQAAEQLQFERAAQYRDQIRAAEKVVERQKVVSGKQEDADVIAFARDEQRGDACVQVFLIRRGKLIGRENFILEGAEDESPNEVISSFLKQFYDEAATIPSRILLPQELDERNIIEQWLRSRRGAQVAIKVPQRGPKRKLVQMAIDNAAETLAALRAQWDADTNRQVAALTELQEALGLQNPPARIECYDVSTLQGAHTVGGMVVFAKGVARKSEYRRFKIRQVTSPGEPDDFASMRDMLRRRFRRLVEEPEDGRPGRQSDNAWRLLPDLVIVDGGKGQLGVALEVLEEFALREVIPVAGLAKQKEELFVPGRKESIALPRGTEGLHLIQRIRDEAHRFAVSYHRNLRSKAQTASALDAVRGIGPKRRKALLRHFGSVRAVKEAEAESLAAVPGMTLSAAQALKAHFASGQASNQATEQANGAIETLESTKQEHDVS